jgi:hypothetical protein
MLEVAQDRQREDGDKVQRRGGQGQFRPGSGGAREGPEHQNGQFEEAQGGDQALHRVSASFQELVGRDTAHLFQGKKDSIDCLSRPTEEEGHL